MKNPAIDTMIENQTQFVNNWMESAKKMQSAFTNGNIVSEGQSLYKEYFDKQVNLLSNIQQSSANFLNMQNANDPQEFFKNWFNQQAGYAKQMADFNQSLQNSFANFGKPAQDYISSFSQGNTAFTNIYNAWLNALNSSYDALNKNMGGAFNKDVFSNFIQGNQVYAKMQEFFQPLADMIQKGQYNPEAFKNLFTTESYANLSKQLFGNLYNDTSIKEFYDNGIKQLQNFFANQNSLSKEYFAQVQNMNGNFPQMFGPSSVENLKKFQEQIQNVFGKTFEPLLKVINPGKEKENAEALIELMDRMADYSIKQAELHAFLQTTTKASIEKIAKQYAEKYSNVQNLTNIPTAQELYSEWVKVNEQLFSELFASEEFSKVKGETLNLSMDVKKHFEKQFENTFSNFPVVFKSEVEELEKTIYGLKKQVKELQNKSAIQGGEEVLEEEKQAKIRKK